MTNPFGNYPSKNIEKREAAANATPTGSTKEILAWVGTDKERAARALEAEKSSSRPRKGVLEPLNGLLDD